MKKVTGQIKLQLQAAKANPSPPVGPALGQHGVNIMGFCKEFNAATKNDAGLEKGSGVPHKDKVGSLTQAQVREIAESKMKDLNANDIEAAAKIIAGTARSMGVTVSD